MGRGRLFAVAMLFVVAALAAPALASAAAPKDCGGVATSSLSIYGLTPDVIAAHGGTTSTAVNAIVKSTCTTTGSPARAAAAALKANGYTASQTAAALKAAFGQTALQSAGILKAVGYSAVDVATALVGSFASTPRDAAQILRTVGFVAFDTAGALATVFSIGGTSLRTQRRSPDTDQHITSALIWHSGWERTPSPRR